MPSRFPPPWTVERIAAGWAIRDANGLWLAYVYCDDVQSVSGQKLSVDEGRRIAQGIARLPELLKTPDR